MKRNLLVILAIAALVAAGCQKKEEAPKTAPQGAMPGAQGGNPHAGIKPVEIPAGIGHKGKVLTTQAAGDWTYVEIEENGKKVWVAVPKVEVKTGAIVEFPDSPPMVNYQSKILNKTFESVIFAPGLRIAGK